MGKEKRDKKNDYQEQTDSSWERLTISRRNILLFSSLTATDLMVRTFSPEIRDFFGRFHFSYNVPSNTNIATTAIPSPSPQPTKDPVLDKIDLPATNDAGIWRAATVKIQSERAMGHGSLILSGLDLYILTIQHVTDLVSEGLNPTISIPNVGTFHMDTDLLHPAWPAKGNETDKAFIYELNHEQKDKIQKAVDDKIIQPLRMVGNNLKPDDVVLIPREERYVYAIYQALKYDSDSNRYELRSPYTDSTPICFGDSGSPILKYPLNGDIVGVLTSVPYFQPEVPLSSRQCSTGAFFRPNF